MIVAIFRDTQILFLSRAQLWRSGLPVRRETRQRMPSANRKRSFGAIEHFLALRRRGLQNHHHARPPSLLHRATWWHHERTASDLSRRPRWSGVV